MAAMMSIREKTLITNTLVCLLKGLEGKATTVEFRNETTVFGTIEAVDHMMNMQLADATFTKLDGTVTTFDSFYVQGKNIRFVQIPDEVNMMRTIKTEVGMFQKTRRHQEGNKKNPGRKSRMKKFELLQRLKATQEAIKSKEASGEVESSLKQS